MLGALICIEYKLEIVNNEDLTFTEILVMTTLSLLFVYGIKYLFGFLHRFFK